MNKEAKVKCGKDDATPLPAEVRLAQLPVDFFRALVLPASLQARQIVFSEIYNSPAIASIADAVGFGRFPAKTSAYTTRHDCANRHFDRLRRTHETRSQHSHIG